jgi:hypothetical protein
MIMAKPLQNALILRNLLGRASEPHFVLSWKPSEEREPGARRDVYEQYSRAAVTPLSLLMKASMAMTNAYNAIN